MANIFFLSVFFFDIKLIEKILECPFAEELKRHHTKSIKKYYTADTQSVFNGFSSLGYT